MWSPDPSVIITAQNKAAEARLAKEQIILAERARRLALGYDYDFGDARGVHRIGTTDADMAGWDEVTKLASALVASGDSTTTITIVTDTGPTTVTGPEWQQVLIAAGQFRQPIWATSFAIQAMDPLPADVTDDGLWNGSLQAG